MPQLKITSQPLLSFILIIMDIKKNIMRMVYKIIFLHSIANSLIQMLQAISEIQVNYEFIRFEMAFQENQQI